MKKIPRLFYYEDAVDAFVPCPDQLDCIIGTDNLDEGEDMEILFKRIDMTDKEFNNLPEV